MASPSNTIPLVFARFLLAAPFLVSGFTTFVFLSKPETIALALDHVQPLMKALDGLGPEIPQDKLAIFLAVMQGMGGFLLVFNHKFGGMLLMLYMLPVTVLTHQFWKVDPANIREQTEVLGRFLQNVAVMGGVLAFMATTDEVPLKVKRKPHSE